MGEWLDVGQRRLYKVKIKIYEGGGGVLTLRG